MATHQFSIIGNNFIPVASGAAFQERYSRIATNDTWQHSVWTFTDTVTKDLIYGTFEVPQNYVSSAKIDVIWTSNVITGDVIFALEYRPIGGNDTESLDQSTSVLSLKTLHTGPSATDRRIRDTFEFTAGSVAAGDTVEVIFGRDGTSESDTKSGKAVVFDLIFRYQD